MTKNTELFRKMMKASRRLKMSAGFPGHGKPMPGMEMCGPRPMGQGMHGHPMGMGPDMMEPRPMGMGHGPHPMGPGFGPEGCHGMKPRPMSRERMLVIISDYPDGVRQKDLAEAAGINASSTSEVVNKLEDDGYLVRTIDETDRRATLLKLTELGEVRAAEIRDEREAKFNELFGKLTEEEKDTLAALLDKMLEE